MLASIPNKPLAYDPELCFAFSPLQHSQALHHRYSSRSSTARATKSKTTAYTISSCSGSKCHPPYSYRPWLLRRKHDSPHASIITRYLGLTRNVGWRSCRPPTSCTAPKRGANVNIYRLNVFAWPNPYCKQDTTWQPSDNRVKKFLAPKTPWLVYILANNRSRADGSLNMR